ncbi:BQ2448_5851 [Microbotryum intermedium]|uniref:BQ2448_5850 protein n=1 Tax=Microbotryum intermedium TaxID=269621 RepID=A0A238F5U2_9BASI|nr:BQ2448_5850 [Microbotryum intermedium]SCV67205.1 BQ2448_5851 [Microbotryum intermedium]
MIIYSTGFSHGRVSVLSPVNCISGGYIGFVWIWNIVWVSPCDLTPSLLVRIHARWLTRAHQRSDPCPSAQFFPLDLVKFGMRAIIGRYQASRKARTAVQDTGVPMTRTQSRTASLYSNRTSFLRRAQASVGLGGKKVSISQNELSRFSSRQAASAGAQLSRAGSRPA